MFDIEGEMMENRAKILAKIESFPTPGRHGDWQCLLHQMVSSYLVHHGFSSTAEAFNKSTGQRIEEDLPSIKNRQNIQRLVLAGKIGDAIHTTEKLYPELLRNNPNLHFMLKVRQFIEMVSGCDSLETILMDEDEDDTSNSNSEDGPIANGNSNAKKDDHATNGNSITPEENNSPTDEGEMEVDPPGRLSVMVNPGRFDKLIKFGQSLQVMLNELEQTKGIKSERNTRLLQDAFSLLAYSDPWSSPVGWQLEHQERESVSAALNSAILESKQLPGRPPLEVALSHTKQLLKSMAGNELGACAFANTDDFFANSGSPQSASSKRSSSLSSQGQKSQTYSVGTSGGDTPMMQ